MRDIPRHLPVLHTTVRTLLSPQAGDMVLDVTLGLGGHALAFAQAIGPKGRLIGLDADAGNLAIAEERLKQEGIAADLRHVNFIELPSLALPPVDILFADLGLSSPHLDDPQRGFTFRGEAPLDMRYDRSSGIAVSALLRTSDVDALTRIFRVFGEVQGARRLAEALAGQDLRTTAQLRAIVEQVFGFRAKGALPQVFQAVRIAVNRELEALDTLLASGPPLLKSGGRMGVISYHSLEDRAVKHVFRRLSTPEKDPLTGKVSVPASYALLTPKAVVPSSEEIARNPRARSAKLRIIQRLPFSA